MEYKVNVHTTPTKAKLTSDLKKSKSYAFAKNDNYLDTIYDRLDISNTCSIERIREQADIYKIKEQNPQVGDIH